MNDGAFETGTVLFGQGNETRECRIFKQGIQLPDELLDSFLSVRLLTRFCHSCECFVCHRIVMGLCDSGAKGSKVDVDIFRCEEADGGRMETLSASESI